MTELVFVLTEISYADVGGAASDPRAMNSVGNVIMTGY
jgi:hypothetical protein